MSENIRFTYCPHCGGVLASAPGGMKPCRCYEGTPDTAPALPEGAAAYWKSAAENVRRDTITEWRTRATAAEERVAELEALLRLAEAKPTVVTTTASARCYDARGENLAARVAELEAKIAALQPPTDTGETKG